jgi:hypothetical protein
MKQLYYIFDYGSGSTWGKYMVPCNCFKVSKDRCGKISLTNVMYASCVPYDGVKNLEIVCGDTLKDLKSCVQQVVDSKPL